MASNISGIQSRLRQFRQRKDWSQEELAAKVDLRRQAIYDMESGKYLPNTAVALRLAALFSCRVEDIFVPPSPVTIEPAVLPEWPLKEGARLALSRIRGALVGMALDQNTLRASDGSVSEAGDGPPLVQVFEPQDVLENNLFILGCDPALELLGGHLRRYMPSAFPHIVFASSKKALDSLAQGTAHAAAVHFHTDGDREGNLLEAEAALPGMPCRILAFSSKEEGLMVERGNLKGICSVADLARPDVRFVNRESGAALRALLQAKLAQNGIPENAVTGFTEHVHSHVEGAVRVLRNVADAALGVRMVADTFGLDFVPLAVTRCDIVVPLDLEIYPAVAALLNALQSSHLRQDLAALPGYDSGLTGNEIALIQ